MRILTFAAAALLLVGTACASDDDESSSSGADAAAAPAAQSLAAQSGPNAAAPPGVSVVGEGRVTGTPDTLRATVGVEVTRPAVDAALATANERATAVIAAVRDQGVAEEDIQTRDVSIRPQHGEPRPEGGQPSIEGYVASNLVEVKIRQIDRAGAVLQAVADAGGDSTRIHGVSFTLEDNQQLLEAAREAAFADARAKAEQYAELAGSDLGGLVAVSEQTTNRPPAQQFGGSEAARDAVAAPAPPVEPGQQEVSVRVEARWNLD